MSRGNINGPKKHTGLKIFGIFTALAATSGITWALTKKDNEQNLTLLQQESESLSNKLSELEEKVTSLSDEGKALTETNADLVSKSAELLNKTTELADENAELKEQNAELEKKLADNATTAQVVQNTVISNSQGTQTTGVVSDNSNTQTVTTSVTDGNINQQNADIDERAYAAAVLRELENEKVNPDEVPELLKEFFEDYCVSELGRSYLRSSKKIEQLKKCHNKFQLLNQMATFWFLGEANNLTNLDQNNFRLADDGAESLIFSPREVQCAIAFIQNYDADQLLKVFGKKVPSYEEMLDNFQTFLEKAQIYYLSAHKPLPLRALFLDKIEEYEKVAKLEAVALNVNIQRDNGKLNSDHTDAVTVETAEMFIKEKMSSNAEILAAAIVDSFARMQTRVDNAEPVFLHKSFGIFKAGLNLIYIDEYDDENNDNSYTRSDKEAQNSPDKTYKALSLLDVVNRGEGDREETRKRCLDSQTRMINAVEKAKELSKILDTSEYLVCFEDEYQNIVTYVFEINSLLNMPYNYDKLTNIRLEKARQASFTLVDGVQRYREDLKAKQKGQGGSTKKTTQTTKTRQEITKEEAEKEDPSVPNQEEDIQNSFDNPDPEAEANRIKAGLAKLAPMVTINDKGEGTNYDAVKQAGAKENIPVTRAWYDAIAAQKYGLVKQAQEEAEVEVNNNNAAAEAEENNNAQKIINDNNVNNDNGLIGEGEQPQSVGEQPDQPAGDQPTGDQPTGDQPDKPADGTSYYNDNPGSTLDHIHHDGSSFGEEDAKVILLKMKQFLAENMDYLSGEKKVAKASQMMKTKKKKKPERKTA